MICTLPPDLFQHLFCIIAFSNFVAVVVLKEGSLEQYISLPVLANVRLIPSQSLNM